MANPVTEHRLPDPVRPGDDPKIEPQPPIARQESIEDIVEVTPPPLRTKIAKGIKSVAISNALWNTVRVTTATLGILGVMSMGPLGIAAVTIGLGFMLISMGMDTAHTRTLRKLDQELSLLQQYNKNAAEEQRLRQEHPDKFRGLDLQPLHEKTAARSDQPLGIEENGFLKGTLTALSINRPLLAGALTISDTVISALTKPIGQLIARVGFAIGAMLFDIKAQSFDLPQTKQMLREEIRLQRQKTTTLSYNSMRELKDKVRDQHVRTAALKALVHPENLLKYEALIRNYQEKYDKEHRKPIAIAVRRFLADFFHSQQPFSDFNNLEKVHERVQLRK